MNKPNNIPALRFPEFEGEWDETTIGKIAIKVNSGKTPLGGESVYLEKGILFIRSQNVIEDHLSCENATFISEELHSTMSNSVVKPNDILLNITGASLGRSCVVPGHIEKANVNQHVCIIRLNQNNHPYFLQLYLTSTKAQNDLFNSQTGSGREGLNFESIKQLRLNITSLIEQTKIASFLTAVDDKIRQLTRKKELLEQYKKGVMQRIFKASGLGYKGLKDERIEGNVKKEIIESSNPENPNSDILRFKDEGGKEYPEWDRNNLGEIANVSKLAGYEFTEHVTYSDSGNIIALRGLNIKNNGLDLTDVKYIDGSNFSKLNRSKLIIDDMMFTYIGTIGEVALIKEDNRFYLAPNVSRIRCKKEQILPMFLMQYFSLPSFKSNEIAKYISSSSQPALTMENVRKFVIPIPCMEEQHKIASFLSSIDIKIKQLTSMLESMQTWKKGLLQKMFV